MAEAAGLPVIFTLQDLEDRRAAPIQTAGWFNKKLKELREAMAPGGVGARVVEACRDISGEDWVFDMVCSCGDAVDVIRHGIVKIYAAFFDKCYDHNMRQPRFDFLVVTVELWMTRIHPSSKGWGCFVKGMNCLPAWGTVRPALLDLTQECSKPGIWRRADGSFNGLHQNDTVSIRAAADFLKRKTDEWYGKSHPRPRFAEELTDMAQFRWMHFLSMKTWCTDVTTSDVDQFWLVWHQDEACFWLRTASNEFFVVQGILRADPSLAPVQDGEVDLTT
jgi:hypothetical protein